jgi:TPR repeat protein
LRKKAEQGDADAQYKLGTLCAQAANIIGKDNSEKYNAGAVEWYRKAAEQGHANAQYKLGVCYAFGQGVAKDETEAVKWYRKAAEQGFAEAQATLGKCFFFGTGVKKNTSEVVKWCRKAAEQGNAEGQSQLAYCYAVGLGLKINAAEAVKWYRKAAEQGNAKAQYNLGVSYANGKGVMKNEAEAVKWYRKAAEQGNAKAQYNLGICYAFGRGVVKNNAEAVKWYRKAAEQGDADGQNNLGNCYISGEGAVKNDVEGYKWCLLAAAQGHDLAKGNTAIAERRLSPAQRAEGQRLAQEWEARHANPDAKQAERKPETAVAGDEPKSTGTGFIITRNGYLVTNHHVVEDTSKVRVQTSAGLLDAEVVRVDDTSDLALLKVAGTFEALPVVSSRSARLGATVATVGFPNVGLQGFEPKLSKGDISSLAGIQDDVRYFQISVPVQPGNSGGALVDEQGNVVGVVTAQLSQKAALESTGTLAQSVNYAVKSSYLLSFLEAVPEAIAEMPDAKTHEQKFEAVVDDVKEATVLIIGY